MADHPSRRFALKVADLLRRERRRKRISMRRLAERSGLSQPTISYIERGLRIPSLETTHRIAAALGVNLALLIQKARDVASRGCR